MNLLRQPGFWSFIALIAVGSAGSCHPGEVRDCLARFEQIVAKCASDLDCQCDAVWTSGVRCFDSCPQQAKDEFVENFGNNQCADSAWKAPAASTASAIPNSLVSDTSTIDGITALFFDHAAMPSGPPQNVRVSSPQSILTVSSAEPARSDPIASDPPTHSPGLYAHKIKRLLSSDFGWGGARSTKNATPKAPAVPSAFQNASEIVAQAVQRNSSAATSLVSSSRISAHSTTESARTAAGPARTTELPAEEMSRRKQLQRMKENLASIRASRKLASLAAATGEPATGSLTSATQTGLAGTAMRGSHPSIHTLIDSENDHAYESGTAKTLSHYLLWISFALVLQYIDAPLLAFFAYVAIAITAILIF